MTKITFPTNGYTLAGNIYVAQEPKKLAFLLIQGWTGHQNISAAQSLADLGFTSLTYDMRGHGGSEGELADFSRADFIDDAVVAYDFLKKQVSPDTRIGVIGSSFGSYTAILLSEKRPVDCLSLRVPANYPDEGFDQPQLAQFHRSDDFKAWRNKALNYTENHALAALHAFKGPIQIIEAGADEVVTSQVPQNYANAVSDKARLSYKVMAGAPHGLASHTLQKEYEKLLMAWVEICQVPSSATE